MIINHMPGIFSMVIQLVNMTMTSYPGIQLLINPTVASSMLVKHKCLLWFIYELQVHEHTEGVPSPQYTQKMANLLGGYD